MEFVENLCIFLNNCDLQVGICITSYEETCSKGFEQKVATLRLKTLLKIKENSIGNFTTS